MTGFYWIASYPKSGNTWLRLSLYSLMTRASRIDFRHPTNFAPVATRRDDIESALGVLSSDLTDDEVERLRPAAYTAMARASRSPLFRKVHDAYTATPEGGPLFPPAVTLGTLYVARDPRDVAVSLASFWGTTIDRAIASMARSRSSHIDRRQSVDAQLPSRLLTWSAHVSSWLDASGRSCCLIRYEDMLDDPHRELARAAAYAGLAFDEAGLAQAVETTRFGSLAAEERRHGFHGAAVDGAAFFRSGRAGGWRDVLTAGQAQRLEREHNAVMRRLGYL